MGPANIAEVCASLWVGEDEQITCSDNEGYCHRVVSLFFSFRVLMEMKLIFSIFIRFNFKAKTSLYFIFYFLVILKCLWCLGGTRIFTVAVCLNETEVRRCSFFMYDDNAF